MTRDTAAKWAVMREVGHGTIQTEMAAGDACRHDTDALYCALHPHEVGYGHEH